MRQRTLAVTLCLILAGPYWLPALVVAIIGAVLSISYNILRGGLAAGPGMRATLIAFVLGWLALSAYDNLVHSRLQKALRTKREELGKGVGLLRSYVLLLKTMSGWWQLGRLLLADYLAYALTQLAPLILSLHFSGANKEQIWLVVAPVTVASPLLSIGLSILISWSNNVFGVKAPDAACVRRT